MSMDRVEQKSQYRDRQYRDRNAKLFHPWDTSTGPSEELVLSAKAAFQYLKSP
jgi:hypothetical protein